MKLPEDDLDWSDRCVTITHPNLMPGWGCCKCRTYNGITRINCKNCDHRRCDVKYDNDDKESN